jgi:hypothetical protein
VLGLLRIGGMLEGGCVYMYHQGSASRWNAPCLYLFAGLRDNVDL